jgi:hypothetical protein
MKNNFRIAPAALAALTSITLVACSTTQPTPAQQASATKSEAAQQAVTQAAVTPLNDLNLVRAEIPEVLRAAAREPYVAPMDKTCAGLTTAIQALDAVLGADLDTPPTAANPSLIDRGSNAAGDAASGALRRTAEGVIPFRGWVRKLTGAERYSREVAAAITAGTIRRAYLKGLGQSAACPAPASPRTPTAQ